MAEQQPLDVNMFTSPFQLTKSMHRDLYHEVEPSNPAISAKGKVVIITGAGGGLGNVCQSTGASRSRSLMLSVGYSSGVG